MISAALIEELNDAVAHGTIGQRAKILQRVTDLFVGASAGYSDAQIDLFDDVLMQVAATIEQSARVALAKRLAKERAPIQDQPPAGIRRRDRRGRPGARTIRAGSTAIPC